MMMEMNTSSRHLNTSSRHLHGHYARESFRKPTFRSAGHAKPDPDRRTTKDPPPNRRESERISRRKPDPASADSPTRPTEPRLLPPLANEGETNLRHYLLALGLPLGLLPAVSSVSNSMASRIVIVENSSEMRKEEGHLMSAGGNFERIEKEDGATRWSEMMQVVDFHRKMAARCWIPTKFWMVNRPENDDDPRRFGVCWGGDRASWPSQKEVAAGALSRTAPSREANPLAGQVRKIRERLEPEARRLADERRFVCVVMCTQGVPTTERGERGPAVLRDYVGSLAELSGLPVKIVFRLCTDDEGVRQFYNAMDVKIDCDVLDDYWGEAMEVYLHNPWLTYGIGIHRLREAGLGTDLMDLLDEKAFDFDEIHKWCTEFFLGNRQGERIRHPSLDWDGFMADLQALLTREKLVWNSVKNKLWPWMDLDKLNSMHQRQNGTKPQPNGSASVRANFERPAMTRTNSARDPPSHDGVFRKSNSVPVRARRSTATSGAPPPFAAPKRSASAPDGMPRRRSTFSREAPARPPRGFGRSAPVEKPADLPSRVRQWSRVAPRFEKLHPLETLLVQVPALFPPSNPFVDPHQYFSKWKVFSQDAFEGESGNALKELLERAARKAKFFLHPDKLPGDLNEGQKTLFRMIWDVVQEAEAALMG